MPTDNLRLDLLPKYIVQKLGYGLLQGFPTDSSPLQEQIVAQRWDSGS